jgi:hypothetical protein
MLLVNVESFWVVSSPSIILQVRLSLPKLLVPLSIIMKIHIPFILLALLEMIVYNGYHRSSILKMSFLRIIVGAVDFH